MEKRANTKERHSKKTIYDSGLIGKPFFLNRVDDSFAGCLFLSYSQA